MKIVELRKKKVTDLGSLVVDLKKESFNLRFQKSGGQLKNTARVRDVRRTIARIKTLQNEAQAASSPKRK